MPFPNIRINTNITVVVENFHIILIVLLQKYIYFSLFQKVADKSVRTPAQFVKTSSKEIRRAEHCHEVKRHSMDYERIK